MLDLSEDNRWFLARLYRPTTSHEKDLNSPGARYQAREGHSIFHSVEDKLFLLGWSLRLDPGKLKFPINLKPFQIYFKLMPVYCFERLKLL
jgi:hypothetical protein